MWSLARRSLGAKIESSMCIHFSGQFFHSMACARVRVWIVFSSLVMVCLSAWEVFKIFLVETNPGTFSSVKAVKPCLSGLGANMMKGEPIIGFKYFAQQMPFDAKNIFLRVHGLPFVCCCLLYSLTTCEVERLLSMGR